MRLRVVRESGASLDLPVTADPERGGYILAAPAATWHGLGTTITGTLHGDWGFAPFEGPVFTLANPESAKWATISRDAAVLPVGRDNALDLVGRSEEHTSELQSLMRISYAVFCLKKKKHKKHEY